MQHTEIRHNEMIEYLLRSARSSDRKDKNMKKLFFTFLITLAVSLSVKVYAQIIKGTYAIKNLQTGLLLRIKDANKADGTLLVAYTPVNWKCVTWDFKHIDGQTYQLRNLFTGKTVESTNESPSAGDTLQQQPLNNTANQQYEFIPVEKDVYLIRLKGTDLYITPYGEKGTVNEPIIFSKKNGTKLQQWTIYEQHPEI